jgi:N-acetylglucosaminyldiphosphoundecaprenol N-acetyl-beta-D-mannosaminyltransferase
MAAIAYRSAEFLFARNTPVWKRGLDVVGSLIGITLTFPLMLLVAISIKLTSPGPVLFRQRRSGLGGVPFTFFKFRSMINNAAEHKDELRKLSEREFPAFKMTTDPRVTKFGQFIRRWSLDELPQFFNVLKGDMSLVGPRPLPCDEAEQQSLWHGRRLDIKPGITCLWQIYARDETSFSRWVRLDIKYAENISLLLDLKLLFLTIPAIVVHGVRGKLAPKKRGAEPAEAVATQPKTYNLIGVGVSATTYGDALEFVFAAARARESACVTHLAVHGLVEGNRNEKFRSILRQFEITAPDGMPLKTALNLMYATGLQDRVYGPEFMLRVCSRAEKEDVGIYLYGSQKHVVDGLKENLLQRYPQLHVVGCEPSLFRPLTEAEDEELINRINDSHAGIVFVGLGCPLQETFAIEHKDKIQVVQICVGAAFDFHSGEKKMAPAWMQRYALEWLFRLLQEPRRLYRRYCVTNTLFLLFFFMQLVGLHRFNSAK